MGSRERWLFPNIVEFVAAVRDKLVVTMQTSRHLGTDLVTKYTSLISRRFEYVWLQYSYVGLWFTVRCDGTQEEKTCQFQQLGTLSLLTAREKAESRVINVSIWVWRGNALYGKNKCRKALQQCDTVCLCFYGL